MDTKKKKQLGPRITQDSYETLARLAAAKGCSLNYYLEEVLEDHVARQRHPDTGGGVMHELVVELDSRFAAHIQRQQNAAGRGLTAAVVQLEKQLDGLKVMIDSMVRTLSPKDHDAYVKTVKATLQKLGPLFENGNGRLQ
jgi:paraquat-inducible protein B